MLLWKYGICIIYSCVFGQAALDCIVTAPKRRKINMEQICLDVGIIVLLCESSWGMTISYCVIWLFLYGEKDTLMVKYSCKENGDVQEGNTNRSFLYNSSIGNSKKEGWEKNTSE